MCRRPNRRFDNRDTDNLAFVCGIELSKKLGSYNTGLKTNEMMPLNKNEENENICIIHLLLVVFNLIGGQHRESSSDLNYIIYSGT